MANKDSVKLALGPASWQVDAFETGVEGVPTLTHEPQDVPSGKEQEVRDVAKANGVSITKKGDS